MNGESINQAELARRINRTTRQIRKLHEKGIPRNANGSYPWPEAFEWWVRFKRSETARRSGTDARPGSELGGIRARKEHALAVQRELEVDQLAGSLMRVTSVDAVAKEVARVAQREIGTIPGRLAKLIAAESDSIKVHEILQDEIDRVLSRIADLLSKRGRAQA